MYEIVEKILASDLLNSSLVFVPNRGASPDEISSEESLLGRAFSSDHKRFLEKWNGIDLEVIRFYGCGDGLQRIRRLADEQVNSLNEQELIVIGSDPSSFIYLEDRNSKVYQFDITSLEIKFLANNLEDLFNRVIFGSDAGNFLGGDAPGNIGAKEKS